MIDIHSSILPQKSVVRLLSQHQKGIQPVKSTALEIAKFLSRSLEEDQLFVSSN